MSNGRAEIIVGRGSFTESFPLFGFDLRKYSELFEEKLELLALLIKEKPVTWEGTLRPPLKDQEVYPKTANGIRTWVGIGGSPESVVRAASFGLPLVVAIIGGEPVRFKPFVDLYHRALTELKQPVLPVAVHCPGFVAATDAEARDLFWPCHKALVDRIGKERGWPPTTRERFEGEVETGALHVGSPETVAKKIAAMLGIQRLQLKYTSGTIRHEHLMTAIELYGKEVIPRVRELLA